MCRIESAKGTAPAGRSARTIYKNCKTRVFATKEDDVEITETGLAQGPTGDRIYGIKNTATGTGGTIKRGAIRGAGEIFEMTALPLY